MAANQEGHTPKASQPTMALISKIPKVLPHERVFPVQIGSELFKLSGASISSDSPSYFSQYFQCQIKEADEKCEDITTAVRTLYIDRDPITFRDIALHLQGYHIEPRDGTHFVRLFADAQFYSLPKLISQLYEESIFISIGHREFQIPRDLFTAPGNSPNFFTLGFAMYFSEPTDVFPGLDREALIRPPSILPPSVPNRSADTFAELLHLLRGYPVEIKSETHRATLLKDCRYFNFKGLEQRLVPHSFGYNQARQRDEITIRLEDILKSGISIAPDPAPTDQSAAWVNYARPFVDDRPAELVLEISSEATKLHLNYNKPSAATASNGGAAPAAPSTATPPSAANSATGPPTFSVRAEFFREARARVAKLLEVVATKLNLPPTTQPLGLLMAKGGAASQPATPGNTPLSEDLVRVVLEPETSIVLDGRKWAEWQQPQDAASESALQQPHKRRRLDSLVRAGSGAEQWIVRSGQWRLHIQSVKGGKAPVECVLVAVKLDAFSSEHTHNAQRGFLTG